MDDSLSRLVENLIGRVTGPMKFRLILQPVMAMFMAVRDGLLDAKAEPEATNHTHSWLPPSGGSSRRSAALRLKPEATKNSRTNRRPSLNRS